MNVKKIALFASGSGTNAQNIIRYFLENKTIVVDSLWSNKPDAPVLQKAALLNTETFIFTRDQFYHSGEVIRILESRKIDLIVLAGFLWLVPEELTKRFVIINIHPALLPAYGGKGMYGERVHRAVLENKDKESGITIHYVNEKYDEGAVIFQARCPVLESDTPETLASRIHELEYRYFPEVIARVIAGL